MSGATLPAQQPRPPRRELPERLAADRLLESRGLHYTFTLQDADEILAAEACICHGSDLVSLVNYRRPEYDSYSVGNALFSHIVKWVSTSGYERIDLDSGAGWDYKPKWAPVGDHKYDVQICGAMRHRAHQVIRQRARFGLAFVESSGAIDRDGDAFEWHRLPPHVARG